MKKLEIWKSYYTDLQTIPLFSEKLLKGISNDCANSLFLYLNLTRDSKRELITTFTS